MARKPNPYGRYIEKRGNRFYAVMKVPADAQEQLGRTRFIEALKTDSPAEARRRAPLLVTKWQTEIAIARQDGTDPLAADAAWFRRRLARAKAPGKQEAVLDAIESWAAEQADAEDSEDNPAPAPLKAEAKALYDAATGTTTDAHLNDWLAGLPDEVKTKDLKRNDVKRLAAKLPVVSQVTRKEVATLCANMLADGKARATVNRTLSSWRGYWSYLQAREVVSEDIDPFRVKVNGSKKAAAATQRQPFEPADVVRLWRAAEKRGDRDLADLIKLAAYTGARIEELCSLDVSRVNLKAGTVTIEDAKTPAGNRVVPIHRELRPILRKRVGNRAEGRLLASLTPNKYGDYSNAIGKRFGNLKRALGFDARYVFHSLRRTVTTMLDHSDVAESVAAAIVGHDIPTMTYGLYSGGASIAMKQEAINKLAYPEWR